MKTDKRKYQKIVAVCLLAIQLFEILSPMAAYALTSGPTAPEVQSFEPAGTTDMVNLFTGDFNYNIPLFELPGPNGGYPFNLAYHAGVGMDQEATWTGLGWNLNPGAINRDVRGLADDYNGDKVEITEDMRKNWTVGVGIGFKWEPVGYDFAVGVGGSTTIYYNSYRGIGYKIGSEVSLKATASNGMSGSFGLNLSLDNQEGTGINPSVGLSRSNGKEGDEAKNSSMTLGIGYNSKRGLTDLSLGFSYKNTGNWGKMKNGGTITKGGSMSASISFSNTAFTPRISTPMAGYGVDFSGSFGVETVTNHFAGNIRGYYTEEDLKYKGVPHTVGAYGYVNQQNASDADMVDINREKEGMITPNIPNLAIPQMTYDIYTIQGQGVGGDFRPFRSDIASTFDNRITSEYGNLASGFGVGVGIPAPPKMPDFKYEINLNINYANTTSGRWNSGSHSFLGADDAGDKTFEPAYFRVNGEPTTEALSAMDYMGGDETVRINLGGVLDGPSMNGFMRKNNTNFTSANRRSKINGTSRKPRNTSILSFRNEEISNATLYPEYKSFYYPKNGASSIGEGDYLSAPNTFNRASYGGTTKGKHIGAYTVLDANGSKYNYALPVYNNVSIDHIYSVVDEDAAAAATKLVNTFNNAGSFDQYMKKTKLPPYSTSHMLTSILGQDYVDVNNDGPTDDDFGYWVKFSYSQVADNSNPYKWRAPYTGANYITDTRTKQKDNKASYMYGEKEMYYLATAETKSHVAVFEVERREDGRGAASETQSFPASNASRGAYSYKLTKIKLYSKAVYGTTGAKPLMTVHFEYYPANMEMCQGVENRDQVGGKGGKLTLKHVWFTYENSARGETNKYEFRYVAKKVDDTPLEYKRLNQDRWGNYKEYSASNPDDIDFPYVDQTESPAAKADRDRNVAAWSLAEILTPTGSKINIEYESDDYGYVQNRVAGQMFKVTRFRNDLAAARIYNSYSSDWNDDSENRKVYFKLEKTLSGSPSLAADEVKRTYLADMKNPEGKAQLYFRILVDMKKHGDGQGKMKEYVSGYAEIEDAGVYDDPSHVGTYTEGWIRLKPVQLGTRTLQGHPFSIAAWTYLRTNLPDIYSLVGQLNAPAGSSQGEAIATAKSIWNAFGSLADLFTDFYRRNFKKDFAQYVDADNSGNVQNCVIRLNTPDKVKYGGGHRVKSIVISDDWNNSTGGTDKKSEYGVAYEYGAPVYNSSGVQTGYESFGVAQYEPILGGDEIALRYSRNYSESVPMKSANNLYFEYPVNEAYFPAAVVGYSKVIVKSLATDRQIRTSAPGSLITSGSSEYVPAVAATTGEAVHEFYTARDFPIITDMTTFHSEKLADQPGSNASKVRQKFFIPVIGIGCVSVDNMSASQGYKIELNDMHGKQKQVTYYGMSKDGKVDRTAPVSYVKYNYQCNPSYSSDIYRPAHGKLTSKVNVLTADGAMEEREMGADYDFFTDARETKTYSVTGGFDLNTDGLGLFAVIIPLILPWPAISYTENFVRTNVANKIIHRTGILSSIEAFDGESKVVTNNMCFDAVSGKPLLTSVNNNFDDPVYSYSMPAHWAYDEIGAAFKNPGITATLDNFMNVTTSPEITMGDLSGSTGQHMFSLFDHGVHTVIKQHLVEGDRVLLWNSATPANSAIARVVMKRNGQPPSPAVASIVVEQLVGAVPDHTTYDRLKIINSGRKNLVNTDAASYKALKNPLSIRPSKYCSVTSPGVAIANPHWDYELFWNRVTNLLGYYLQTYGTGDYTVTVSDNLWANYIIGNYNIDRIDFVHHYSEVYNTVTYWISFYKNGNEVCYGTFGSFSLEDCPSNKFIFTNSFTNVSVGGGTFFGKRCYTCKPDITPGSLYIPPPCNLDATLRITTCMGIDTVVDTIPCDAYRYTTIDKVISATAQKYSDKWHHTFNDVESQALRTSLRVDGDYNPYRTGEAGIWRAQESFTYVDDREQSTSPGVKTKTDGTFSTVPVFQWKTPFFVDFPCDNVGKWRQTNTVTQYDLNSNEDENRNILDIYSSALFGYKGQLATAVATNAEQKEIGFESFEEYNPSTGANEFNNATGNFDFVTNYVNGSYYRYDGYKILLGSGLTFDFDLPYSEASKFHVGDLVKVIAESPQDDATGFDYWKTILRDCKIASIAYAPCSSPNTSDCNIRITIEEPAGLDIRYNTLERLKNHCWRGEMVVEKKVDASAKSLTAQFTSEKAHTGKQSYKVIASTDIPQLSFELRKNEKYALDLWISRADANTHNYAGNYVVVKYYDALGALINMDNFGTTGEVIEGWQKVEGTFDTPSDIHHISIELSGSESDAVYYDDIRLYPFNGNMKCFVYDPANYKLRATLNENNYSTRYFYDEKGELVLTKVETQKGIETIQEVRKYTKGN